MKITLNYKKLLQHPKYTFRSHAIKALELVENHNMVKTILRWVLENERNYSPLMAALEIIEIKALGFPGIMDELIPDIVPFLNPDHIKTSDGRKKTMENQAGATLMQIWGLENNPTKGNKTPGYTWYQLDQAEKDSWIAKLKVDYQNPVNAFNGLQL